MRGNTCYVGVACLLLALILACGAESATPPPAVAQGSYDASTQTLRLTLSDGATLEVSLDQLVTHAAFDETLWELRQPDPRFFVTEDEIQAAMEDALLGLEPDTVLVNAHYDPVAEQLVLTMSDGTTVRADLSELATDEEVGAYIDGLAVVFDEALRGAIRPTPTAIPTAPPTPRPRPTPQTPARQHGILDVGMANLGPYMATNYDASYFQNRFAELVTHETLFVMGYDGEWEPRLVKGFEVSPEALTYTIHLQEGAEWHKWTHHGDWGEFNADDFIWTIQEVSREGSYHAQARNTRNLFACEGCMVTKIDDYTVELKRPTPTFQITWFSQAPIPGFSMNSKRHFDEVGQQAAIHQDVGTGPWEQVEYVTDVRRHVRAVEDHWRTTPEFDEMIWHDIPETTARLANFQSGLLDTGIFNSDSIRAILDAPVEGLSFMVFSGAIIQMLWHEGGHYIPNSRHHSPDREGNVLVPIDEFYGDYRNICDDSEIVDGVATEMSSNERRPWISCDRDVDSLEWERSRKVREAMLRGIDREALINNIAFGEGEPWYFGYWANRGRMRQLGLDGLGYGDMDYDFPAAKELLAEAGYPNGFDVRVNKRLGTGTLLLVKDAVATDWLELGLDVTLQDQSPASYRMMSEGRRTNDIYGLNDAPSFPEPLRMYSVVYSSRGRNLLGVNHPEMDRLIEDAGRELDTDVRWQIQGDLARFIYDNVLAMPLYAENAIWPLGPEVDSWQVAPAELDWLTYWENARRR